MQYMFYIERKHCFPHHSLKSCPAKFQQKRQLRSASGQSKRPRRQLWVPDAPNYVFRENRLPNMRKMQARCEIDENLANDAKT